VVRPKKKLLGKIAESKSNGKKCSEKKFLKLKREKGKKRKTT